MAWWLFNTTEFALGLEKKIAADVFVITTKGQ